MLRLYQSDKLEILGEALAAEYEPPASPFTPDIIIVPSQGMGRWVSLRLAEKLGICAHVRFVLPASFVWERLRGLFGELPKRSPFSSEVLAFRIMAWLGRSENLARAPRLAGYLRDGEELRRFQLAVRIADMFDQYLVYREDWIAAWDRGETLGLGNDEDWQARLWRDLASEASVPHRAQFMSQLLAGIAGAREANSLSRTGTGGESKAGDASSRLVVFGVSSLPPVFLNVLEALGKRTDVAIYALNPCREYWGEIRDEREISRLAGESRPEDLYLEVGHPLLASLGKQGREFFDALAECAEVRPLFEAEPRRDSLLHLLQADILELVDRRSAGKLAISPDDRSLQIHVCHSPMREVEVLRDQLLARFDADPDLQPGEVAVLTPDIEKYAPYIEAVFVGGRGVPRIPFSIADRGLAHHHPLLESFLALLDLPESRFCADATLAFLEQPAILRRFGLREDDLPLIHDWTRAVGARWGRDGLHKAEHGLPEIPRHTWRFALQRLMLGYALPESLAGGGLPLFEGALPYDDIEGGRALTLGRFADFLEALFDWAERLKKDCPPEAWAERLNALVDRLVDPRGEEETAVLKLRCAFDALRELAEQAAFRDPIGVRVVKSWLAARLAEPLGSAGFLTGEITFCAMVPMRSLPFKLIAVLGLDYDAFPRDRHPPGFDLLARHPRRGDRSRRLDDRYLFLETLLSARETLYLSYVGRNIRDNRVQPPSPLVSELLEVVKQSVELPNSLFEGEGSSLETQLVTVHPLQPFDPAYFRDDPRLPGFSATWLNAARGLGRGEKKPAPLFDRDLPEPEEDAWTSIDVEEVLRFYGNPARFLLQKRLNIFLETVPNRCEIREPFALDHFTALSIREECLAALLDGRPTDDLAYLAEARGALPHGAFGARLHAREQALAQKLLSAVRPFLGEGRRPPFEIHFKADGTELEGWLRGVSSHGLVDSIPDNFRERHAFGLWFRHLLLCQLRPADTRLESRLFCLDRSLALSAVKAPERELRKLLGHFRRGLRRPLAFFVKSAYVYTEQVRRRGADADAALRAAHKVWDEPEYRNGSHYGESENPYYQAVYRGVDPLDGEFQNLSLEIFGPFFDALVPE